ncbi:MAG TPA: alpha/beta fold hydrolase [Acidimicrobiales bacterium]|jgi:hypothetical protein|nr:alpha/beta fold hydrolase [Acidimicrobiales bacterium]
MPILSACVACGRELCARCIVRTPVGFKCGECTGEKPVPEPRRSRPPIDAAVEPRARRRPTALIVGLAVLLLAGGAYLAFRPTSHAVRTTVPPPTASGPTDIAVSFPGASGHQLSGDLLLPAGAGASVPAVVIVPDWGEVDRNGTVPAGSLPDPLYLDLAQALAHQGIASLRYDPAGQGQSTIPQGTAMRFEDQVGDADAALKLVAGRVGIDTTRLTVVGNGWGGLAALRLAAEDHRVRRLVLISTPGRPAVESIADELQATALTPTDGMTAVQQLRQSVTSLSAGGHLPAPASLETALRPLLPPDQEAYLRDVFGLDPAALARTANIPALVVRGAEDPGISASDVQLLAGALGPASQVLVADHANRTLSILTQTFAPGTTTVPTPNGGMQNVHLPTATVTITRDDATLAAVVRWAAFTTSSAG